jgi:phosphohistidine phosphatase
MRLYLVQHGEAVPEAVDPARPLTAGGQADVARIAAFLAAAGVRAARVMHSGKRRAEQTAEVLAAALAPATAPAARTGLNPNDPTDGVAHEAAAWSEDVMLVGHLPLMARLASRLVAGREDAGVATFRPGSVLCLERADQQRWTIAWMVRPELLPDSERSSAARPGRSAAAATGR